MESVLRKWGNSAAVRLPAQALRVSRLNVDDEVELKVEEGRIVIERRQPQEISLDALLDRITPDNVHEAVDTGPALGREAW